MTCGIYKITNKENGKCYIGQSVNIEKRWGRHCYSGNKKCSALRCAIDKYGKENMTFEILEEMPRDKSKLNESEIYYIKLYDSVSPNGYNLKSGGDSGIPCEETKMKIKEKRKNQIFTEETRKKMSEAMKGKTSPMKGKTHTEETRMKIKEKRKNQIFTEETKMKMSESRKGKTHTEETRKKMSESRKGKEPSNKGKSPTEETRKKLSESNKGKSPSNKGKKLNKETRKYE